MAPGFLVGVFGASLLASLHCAGMCGPFVAFYSASGTKRAHVSYHVTRAIMYSSLGALAGAFGSGVDLMGRELGALRLAALVASALTIAWGVLAFVPRARLGGLIPAFAPNRLITLKRKGAVTKATVLGLTTPLLPCGTLYAFVTLASGTGSAQSGALTMLVFFLGTLPGLVGLGALTARLGHWFGARLPRALGATLIVIGLFGVYERSRGLMALDRAPEGESCHGQH